MIITALNVIEYLQKFKVQLTNKINIAIILKIIQGNVKITWY